MGWGGQLHACVQCADSGSDEVYAGKLITTMSLAEPKFVHFRTACYKHQAHLGVKGGMTLADAILAEMGVRWRYYSTLDAAFVFVLTSMPRSYSRFSRVRLPSSSNPV
eukprot:2985967-Pyramimonas_sp.AAC.1